MRVTEYTIEIYQPSEPGSVWASFTSETPFMPIREGDFISPAFTYDREPGEPEFESKGSGLRVSRVEHAIRSTDGETISHKLLVFTEEAENPWTEGS
ncbi:MAG TPA: hypothetical protein VN282_05610 [Pyrinomonadaceae bacterium]|nr:hypothetical protein [Pyrinomonadaceae bacterium]